MNDENFLVDLHCHSTASDGHLSPADLVRRAIDCGVDMLAITDHDTVDGLDEAHLANSAAASPLSLIDGAEISTRWHSFDIHIVGLNLDRKHVPLLEFLANQRALRDTRAREIGERLAKAGIEGTYERARELAGTAAVSRGHYARVLVERGVAKDMASVFKRYLARNKTGYVPNNWGDMASAIEIIHAAGGVAVLAHPSGYKLSAKWLKKLVREFKEAGGDAMEVVLGQQTLEDRANLVALSHQNGLAGCLGSDFHFPGSFIELGKNLYRPPGITWVWQTESWGTRV
ncbi:PHP domain-containing protein [Shewanella sp. JM162201]|uniref:PHP domain-containing protein n=1 Tax=Shewanella jiangmenensis TaxID=2837387 RepID=A0ABS5V8Z8_9GAMM|nr:PHP domain-containing protein [Shewanella jiangmenensis]MBT1446468.1 PHP domain-containing protein [Shewanella jiangmenensis]